MKTLSIQRILFYIRAHMDMYIFAFPITSYKPIYSSYIGRIIWLILYRLQSIWKKWNWKILFKVIKGDNTEKTVYKWQLIVNKKSKYWHDANERTYLRNALDDHSVLLKVNIVIALRKSVSQQTNRSPILQFDIQIRGPKAPCQWNINGLPIVEWDRALSVE